MKNLGSSTLTFRKDNLDIALNKIKGARLDVIDLAVIPNFHNFNIMEISELELKELKEEILRKELRVATLNTSSGKPLNDLEQRKYIVEYTKKCLQLAKDLGSYAITLQPGRKVAPENWHDSSKIIYDTLAKITEYGHSMEIDITLESPHYKSFVEDFEQAEELNAILSDLNVGITLDTSHVIMSKTTISNAVKKFAKSIRHIHLRDVKGDDFLVTPGDGEIDFKSFFELMAGIGYKGDFVLELEYRDLPEEKREDELAKAKKYLEAL